MSKQLVVIRQVITEQRFVINVNDTQAEDDIWIDSVVDDIERDPEGYDDVLVSADVVGSATPRYRIEG